MLNEKGKNGFVNFGQIIGYVCLILTFLFCHGFFTGSQSFAENSSSTPPEGYTPTKLLKSYRANEQNSDILMIQTSLPWDSDANTTVLNSLNYSVRTIDMTDVPDTDINSYQVILIVNDQVQSFYDSYSANYQKFENYVKNGGTLVFFACDMGWAEGDLTSPLPGGVLTTNQNECNNYIADNSHAVITGQLTKNNEPLTDDDTKNSWMSHGYFNNLDQLAANGSIRNLKVIFRGSDSNMPIFIEYSVGDGTVIASMNTWEFAYYHPDGYYDDDGCYRGSYAVKALDDVFKYAFSIAGGHKSSGIQSSVYVDDAREEATAPLKARNDIIDFAGQITNNDPEGNTHAVNLSFLIPKELQVVKVFKRKDFADYSDYPDPNANNVTRKEVSFSADDIIDNKRKVTIQQIEVASAKTSDEYVVRVRIPDDFPFTETYNKDAHSVFTEVSGLSVETKQSDSRYFSVVKMANLIVTNRRLLFEAYDKSEVQNLLSYIHEIASGYPPSIVYYVDEYDESDNWTGKNPDGMPFTDWYDVRKDSNSWYTKCYNGDAKFNRDEESCINTTTNQVDAYVNYWIDNLGGAKAENKIFLTIIGGDDVIPHYRVWDPKQGTKDHLYWVGKFSETQKKAGEENYIFSDIIFYDTDNKRWGEGDGLENVYIGRILGNTGVDLLNLFKNGIWKSEQLELTRSLLLITREESYPARNVWGNPVNSHHGGWLIVKKDSPDDSGINLVDNDFVSFESKDNYTFISKDNLFNSINKYDLDLIWSYHHGSPYGLSGSAGGTDDKGNKKFLSKASYNLDKGYPPLISGNDWSSASVDNLEKTRPIWIASACFSGIVDGGGKENKDYFASGTLKQYFSGLLGSSTVTWGNQKASQKSIADKIVLDEQSVGRAIKESKKGLGDGDWQASTRFAYIYYGVPWVQLKKALIAKRSDIIRERSESRDVFNRQGQKTILQTEKIESYSKDSIDGYDK